MPVHSHGALVHSHRHGLDAHAHSPEVHLHLEQKPEGPIQKILARIGLYQLLRPLAVGIVHGLAESSAVALLVLTTIRNPRWAVFYLFGLWSGNHWRNDADNDDHWCAIWVHGQALYKFQPRTRGGIRAG